MTDLTISDFTHIAPKGYFYSFEDFKKNVIRIWLHNNYKFDYNNGKPTKTVWGFWNSKTNQFFSPVNHMTVGKKVEFEKTRNYTAMTLNQTPLEACFK